MTCKLHPTAKTNSFAWKNPFTNIRVVVTRCPVCDVPPFDPCEYSP